MKENKKFFYNNRLNKGYKKINNTDQTDLSLMKQLNGFNMPSIEILAQYEEQHPGSFKTLFNMAQKEQEHRHKVNLMEIAQNNRANNMGRIFALLYISLIMIGSVILSITDNYFNATLFIIFGFACIMGVSYFYSTPNNNKTRNFSARNIKKNPVNNNR